MAKHRIEILHVPDCAGGRAAVAVASAIAASRDDVEIAEVVITGPVEAVERGLRGSPTVLVDGREIEPEPGTPAGTMG